LNLQTGKILDKIKVDGGIRAGLIADNEDIYVATESGWLYEFTTFGSFSLWGKTSLDYPVYAAPLLTKDKIIVGFVRDSYYPDPAVFALRRNGKDNRKDYIWFGKDSLHNEGDDYGNIRFTPGQFKNMLIFGNPYSNFIYAIDENNGNVLWRKSLGQKMFQHWSSPLVASRAVYVARHDGLVHKINPENGSRIWSVFLGSKKSAGLTFSSDSQLPGENYPTQWNPLASNAIFSTPAYSDGLLAVTSAEGYLFVLDNL
jgi:outer membrane protein assembly factor BamB